VKPGNEPAAREQLDDQRSRRQADLDPAIWPASARRRAGVLHVGGVDVRDLAAEYGTPTYVLDENDFRARCCSWRAALPDGNVCYAGKAFLCLAVARWVDEEGLGLDVSSGGELEVALRAGFPPARITFHGNNKSLAELRAAVQAGVGRVVLDSFTEIARLAHVAHGLGAIQAVLVRATVGVQAHTHEFVATAHEDQKFGFSLDSGAAAEAIRRVRKLASLDLVGVHSHIGSQIFDAAGFEISAHRVVGLLAEVRDEHGVELPELNLGGGLGIAYVAGDDPIDAPTLVGQLVGIVERECGTAGLRVPRLAVEPGRSIAGPPTLTLYEVGTVKGVEGLRSYASVDGGMSDNIRTALYGADYTCALASRRSEEVTVPTRVVGKHCETGDVIVPDARLPADLVPGDLLAVAATGAYCMSMASNYNHLPRPPVIAVRDGAGSVLVRREQLDDLLRLDAPVPPRQRLASQTEPASR
jgi:diaminopimelate decarboxylase